MIASSATGTAGPSTVSLSRANAESRDLAFTAMGREVALNVVSTSRRAAIERLAASVGGIRYADVAAFLLARAAATGLAGAGNTVRSGAAWLVTVTAVIVICLGVGADCPADGACCTATGAVQARQFTRTRVAA